MVALVQSKEYAVTDVEFNRLVLGVVSFLGGGVSEGESGFSLVLMEKSHFVVIRVSEVGLDDDTKRRCERLASKEVARAVADLRV